MPAHTRKIVNRSLVIGSKKGGTARRRVGLRCNNGLDGELLQGRQLVVDLQSSFRREVAFIARRLRNAECVEDSCKPSFSSFTASQRQTAERFRRLFPDHDLGPPGGLLTVDVSAECIAVPDAGDMYRL